MLIEERTSPPAPAADVAATAAATAGPAVAPGAEQGFAVELVDVNKSFGERAILKGLTLRIPGHKTTCLIGGSGSGKSVTLKLIARLLKPDSGQVIVDGEDVSQAAGAGLDHARQSMGFVFQSGGLLRSLTVAENVALPLRETTALGEAEIQERVAKALELLKLTESRDLMPAEISGGMVKRVALARAVVHEPKVVLYDEPTTGLDPVNAARVDEMIIDLRKSLDVTQIVVTHNMTSAFRIGDRIAFLHEGKIHFEGSAKEAQETDDPILRQFIEGGTEGPLAHEE